MVCDSFEEGGFISFRQIQVKHNILQKHLFGFLQVRDFVQSSLIFPDVQPSLNPVERVLLKFNEGPDHKKKSIIFFNDAKCSYN